MKNVARILWFLYFSVLSCAIEIKHDGFQPSLLQLYNIRNEEFLPVRLGNPPKSFHMQKQLGKSVTRKGITKEWNRKSSDLNLFPQTELQVRLGLLRVNAALAAVSSIWTSSSAKSIQGYLTITQEYLQLDIDACNPQLNTFINNDYLLSDVFEATHILVGIFYGLEVDFTFTSFQQEEEGSSMTEIELSLAVEKAYQISSSWNASVNNNKSNSGEFSNIKVDIVSNINCGFSLPKNIDDIQIYMEKLKSALERTNNGSGTPIRYKLADIGTIRKCHEIISGRNKRSSDISALKAQAINKFIESQRIETNLVRNWLQDIYSFKPCLPGITDDGIDLLQLKLHQFTTIYEDKLRNAFLRFSYGDSTQDHFEDVITEYTKHKYNPKNITRILNEEYNSEKNKLLLFRKLESHSISCFPTTMEPYLSFNKGVQFYFLYNSKSIRSRSFTQKMVMFIDACQKLDKNKDNCYIVDCHYHEKFSVCGHSSNERFKLFNSIREEIKITVEAGEVKFPYLGSKTCLRFHNFVRTGIWYITPLQMQALISKVFNCPRLIKIGL